MSARGRYTLLVVDDIEAARYAVVRSSRHDGFLAREASDGETALKLAEFVEPADQSMALAIGADAYFVPPVDPQALASTLDALLLSR